MNDEFESIDTFDPNGDNYPKSLPNATAVLVLGILSIVTCVFYGIIGIILGIIALVLHKKDNEMYRTNTTAYAASYKNSNAGKICAIIGLILSSLWLVYMVVVIIILASGGMNNGSYYY